MEWSKQGTTGRGDAFTIFTKLPYVHSVHATVSQGAVKHYNVCIKTANAEIASELMSLWPYCVVSSENGEIIANYLVKPEEVRAFAAKLSRAGCLAQCLRQNSVVLIFHFRRPVTEEFKHKVSRFIRSTDRLVWGDMRMAVVLSNPSEEAVRAVETRIKNLLREYYGSEEVAIMEHVS